jgi:Ca-activated chloride channel family protein
VVPEQIPPREYVFILDVSGSMTGFPLDVAKQLLADLIGGLRSSDRFNVILFSGGAAVLSERSLPATRANVDQAIRVIERQQGGGGTELSSALRSALSLPGEAGWSRSFVVLTDGYIGAEPEAFATIREHLGDANVFAFGIGSSVNRHLIEGLARAGGGEPFVATNAQEGEVVAQRFREYVSAPVLTDVEVAFEGAEAYDLEPPTVPDVLARRPVIVHGKLRGALEGKVTVRGISGQGAYAQTFDLANVRASQANRALPYLWARTRIANLSDFAAETEETRKQIVELGLAYNLLTRYTSFIAVLHEVRNAGGAGEQVAQPLPLPEGVSEAALPMEAGSEPELVLLAALFAVIAAVLTLRRRRVRA